MRVGRRFNKLERQLETRTANPKIVIFTEGARTERDYFKTIGRKFGKVVIEIEIIAGAGVPLTLAQKAEERAAQDRVDQKTQDASKNDQYWIVFDRDEHPRIDEATALCASSGIQVAFSNPCFELWLILHLEDFGRQDDRHQVQRHLASICESYDRVRRKSADFENFFLNIHAAEKRAASLCQRRSEEGDPFGRPMTTVYLLTREIRRLAQPA